MDFISEVFGGLEVRTVVEPDGTELYVAKDVAVALGYRDSAQLLRIIAEEDHAGYRIVMTKSRNRAGECLRPGMMVVLRESGVYSALFHSTKPEAKRFRKHLTSVVLPSILGSNAIASIIQQ